MRIPTLAILALLTLGSCSENGAGEVPRSSLPVVKQGDYHVSGAREVTDADWAALPFSRISIGRGGCYGPCPIYSAEFLRSGVALYSGELYTPREGEFEAELHYDSFALLCSLAERLGLEELDSEYLAAWTDDETITIQFERDGASSTIQDYGRQAPPEFQAFRALFDELIEQQDWSRVGK